MSERPRIVLCMIVKDEAHVIERCIESVRPFIDAWCIVDTGSTDDTEPVIRNALRDLPGDVHHREWVDFSTNRNQSIELARSLGDYILVMDADDTLHYPEGHQLPHPMNADCYDIRVDQGGVFHRRTHLFKTSLPFRYRGVLHEALHLGQPHTRAVWKDVLYRWNGDGARSKDPSKYLRDADVLKSALEAEPDHKRYWFYLGQTYLSADRPIEAIYAYQRRIALGGEEEVFLSYLQIASILGRTEAPEHEVLTAFMRAYENRPTRAEPLVYLASYYKRHEKWALARLYARLACGMKRPADRLLVDEACHSWRPWAIRGFTSMKLGDYAEAAKCSERLIVLREGDDDAVAKARHNLTFCRNKLKELRGR